MYAMHFSIVKQVAMQAEYPTFTLKIGRISLQRLADVYFKSWLNRVLKDRGHILTRESYRPSLFFSNTCIPNLSPDKSKENPTCY